MAHTKQFPIYIHRTISEASSAGLVVFPPHAVFNSVQNRFQVICHTRKQLGWHPVAISNESPIMMKSTDVTNPKKKARKPPREYKPDS